MELLPRLADVQNELARIDLDCLNTEGHNEQLSTALALLDAEIKDKVHCLTCLRTHVALDATMLMQCHP